MENFRAKLFIFANYNLAKNLDLPFAKCYNANAAAITNQKGDFQYGKATERKA